jgi:hypothetical protein
MSNFEDEYLDVLQNIEYAIVSIYRQNPELTDYEVDKVLNTLIRAFQAEQGQRTFTKPALSPSSEQVYAAVQFVSDLRLGRENSESKDIGSSVSTPEPITVDEMIDCLKRIRKSVEKWNKQGGTRGYLQFIDQFIL